jgi:hypothetical protein
MPQNAFLNSKLKVKSGKLTLQGFYYPKVFYGILVQVIFVHFFMLLLMCQLLIGGCKKKSFKVHPDIS